jgi:hypothetical protein
MKYLENNGMNPNLPSTLGCMTVSFDVKRRAVSTFRRTADTRQGQCYSIGHAHLTADIVLPFWYCAQLVYFIPTRARSSRLPRLPTVVLKSSKGVIAWADTVLTIQCRFTNANFNTDASRLRKSTGSVNRI